MENSIYAKVPQNKPANAAVYQLKPVELNGSQFYGWKMVYLKQIPSGNKTKEGRIKYKTVTDTSKPVVFDPTTTQMNNSKSSNQMMLSLLNDFAQQRIQAKNQNLMIIKLMNQVAKLSIGGNK